MCKKPWPPYRAGNAEYMHAIGVVASKYNLLELRFRSLFPIYTRIPTPAAYKLFGKTNNEMRSELMHDGIDFSSHPESIKNDVRHFLAGYKICSDNRNIFMHATTFYVFGADDVTGPEAAPTGHQPLGFGLQKAPKGNPFQIYTYKPTIEEVRAIADAIEAFQQYGDGFTTNLRAFRPSAFLNRCSAHCPANPLYQVLSFQLAMLKLRLNRERLK